MLNMRTTLTLDDDLGRDLRELAHRTGRSFKQVVNDTLRRGLAGGDERSTAPAPLPSIRLGKPSPDLTKALRLAAQMEDEEVARKLALRK